MADGAPPSRLSPPTRSPSLADLIDRVPREGRVGRLLAVSRVGPGASHAQPARGRLVLATAAALACSLVADAVLVAAGKSLFPSTRGFSHFRFFDYATLTVIGVLVACVAWPLVTRLSYAPRWLFVRLAVLVTIGALLPDAWILARGEPPKGVAVLVTMHLAIAVVTYNALVRLAPVRPAPAEEDDGGSGRPEGLGAPREALPGSVVDGSVTPASKGGAAERRAAWVLLDCLVGLELLLGMAALALVPFGRASAWIPSRGTVTYLAHSVAGVALAVGSIWLVAATRGSSRIRRIAALFGFAGVVLAGLGGLLTVWHGARLAGAGLMLLGGSLAGCAYLTPLVEGPRPAPAGEAGSVAPPSGDGCEREAAQH